MPSARPKPVSRITAPAIAVADERVEVGEHVLEGALDVERRAVRRGPARQVGGDVDRDADQRDDEHQPALDVGRVDQPLDGLEAITPARTSSVAPLTWAERISARPRPKVNAPRGGRAASASGDQRQGDRAGVGEHVRGVGEQGQRAGQQAGHDLGHHEAEDQRRARASRLPRSASGDTAW